MRTKTSSITSVEQELILPCVKAIKEFVHQQDELCRLLAVVISKSLHHAADRVAEDLQHCTMTQQV